MFFTLSKTVGWLLVPHNMLGLMVCAAAILLLTRWRRWGARLAGVAAVFCVVVAMTPLPEWSLLLLEDRFPRPAILPARIDGIIVLGGSIGPALSHRRDQVALKSNAERMTEGAGLAHRYPSARLIFTGGDSSLSQHGLTEARFAPFVFAQMGLGPERVEVDDQARNTYENAVRVAALVAETDADGDGVWVLVTSAYHMPRAVGCFRRAGLPVIPFPVDYRSDGMLSLAIGRFNMAEGLALLALAIHEWIGLITYRFNGYVEDVFPAPRPTAAARLTTARESRTAEP